MQLNLNVTKIVVVLTNGCDVVLLKTDQMCPFIKSGLESQQPLELTFKCSYNTSINYLQKTFGLSPDEVVNIR